VGTLHFGGLDLYASGVCFVMSYLKPDQAGRDDHIWSPALASVNRGYHKILGGVKVGGMQTHRLRRALPTTLGQWIVMHVALGHVYCFLVFRDRLTVVLPLLKEVPAYAPKLHCTAAIA
jgi:hypothetical protein